MHVWVLRSPANEEVVQRLWAEVDGESSLESGATLFGSAAEEPGDACEAILATIEEHHGEWSHDPPLDVLEVFGIAATPAIRDELTALGFVDVQPRPGGFVTSRATER
jgi:hypothetical protein